MTQNEIKLAEVEARIASADPAKIHLYSALIGIRHLRAEVESKALAELLWQMNAVTKIETSAGESSLCEPHDCGAKLSFQFARQGGGYQELTELGQIHAAVSLLENHPDMAEARATLEPLCALREEARALVAADRATLAAAVGEAQEAERAALERAQLAAANDPALLAARERLDRLENPPPLVRGKFKVPAIA